MADRWRRAPWRATGGRSRRPKDDRQDVYLIAGSVDIVESDRTKATYNAGTFFFPG
jgi:uncharacterized cupin superfamily protein